MAGRSPAGPLMREHRVIERMLAVLARELASAGADGPVNSKVIDAGTHFIREYADRCHHGKEEDILFRELATKDLDSEVAAAMDGLIADHVRGRGLTRTLVAANARYAEGDSAARDEVVATTRALIDFYPVHIAKEDRYFFKASLEYFSDAEKARMLAGFDEFDRDLIHEVYRSLVERLEQGLV